MSEPLIHTLSLLYEIQSERGKALLPLSQLMVEETNPFDEQTKITHHRLTLAQKACPDFWALLPERFFDAYALRNNAEFRTQQTTESLMEWYMFNLEHPIHQMASSLLTDNPRFAPAQTSALIHFIASLSYLNQLRDMGVIIYGKAEITTVDNRRMKNVASSYLARERLYLGLADESFKQMIDAARTPSLQTMGQLDQIIRKIRDGFAKGILASTSLPNWLEIFNAEITGLKESLFQTIRGLDAQGQALAVQSTTGQVLDSDVDHQFASIAALPLFRGLSEATLRSILKGARLIRAPKNQTLMTQGEALSRFLIVMDGLVKTTKAAEDGQESILQIIGKKECLLDTGYINAPMASLSVKTVTEAHILSISLPVLRDHVSRNRELAQNLLAATTTRLQRFVAHFEQITLSSAKERVGWFLANLHLETGLEGAPLKLPFDKALIATYLNIKPETFSRVLKDFRDQGFVIEKDKVIMPSIRALCGYCEPEMALRCCRAETMNCPPIQAARRAEGKAEKQ